MLIRKLSRKFSRGRRESDAVQAAPAVAPPAALREAPVTKSGWLNRHVPPKFVGRKRWAPSFVTLRSHFLTLARSGGAGTGIDQWYDLRGAVTSGSARNLDGEHVGCVLVLQWRATPTAKQSASREA